MLIPPETTMVQVPASEHVPAHRIACYEWNQTAKETVLCMHGLTRNARDFDVLASSLADRYRVIALDMPGRGKSDYLPPIHYHYGTYISDTLHVLAQLGIQRLHWVGTSMGGIIGMMAAHSAPALFQSLTLNDIGCLIPATGLARILSYAGVNTCFRARSEAEAAMRQNCAPFGISDETHWQHLFAHSIMQKEDGFYFTYDPGIIASFPKDAPIEDVNLWMLWEQVKAVPTLLLRGVTSDILLKKTALQMQSLHPKLGYKEIENCGHAPSLMDSEHIQEISKWIRAA